MGDEIGVAGVGGGGLRTCHNAWCDFTTREQLSVCPECGRQLLTDYAYRGMGWLMVIPGALFAAGGAALIVFAAPKLQGGTGLKVLVYGIFGGLMLLGLAFMTTGLMQALSGRKHSSLIAVAVVILAAIAILVAITRLLF